MPVENMEVRSAGDPRRTDLPPALMVERMRKTFGSRRVLDIEGLEVRPGSVHALLGQNGSGKSTLIKVLSGFHPADEADADAVLVSGRALVDARSEDCRFVHQDLGLIPEMSVLDNLYLVRGFPTRNGAVATSHAEQSARSALTLVGLDHQDVNALVSDLSPARRTAIAIARALMDGGDTVKLLVLDEPTATLPRPDVADLMSTLRTIASKGVGVLYVTHHLDEVFEIADDVTILRDGVVVAAGPIGAFDRESVVHHLAGDIMESVRDAIVSYPPIPTGQAVFSAANVVGERVEGVSVELRAGEIVGFHGLTGSGRDTLLGVLYGSRVRSAGSVVVVGKTLAPGRPDLAIANEIGFVSASRKFDGIVMELTCRENLMLTATGRRRPGMRIDRRAERAETLEWIDRLQIRPTDAVDVPVAQLSGGNQQKVAIARWLRLQPQVLMLDEPTQGVDVGAKAQIHTALTAAAAEGAAILIASSDVEELASLCSVVHVMQHGRILDSVSGVNITVSQLNRRLNQATHDSIGSSP